MNKKILFAIILFFIVNSNSYSHSFDWAVGVVLSSQIRYDFRDKNISAGLNVNAVEFFVNGSLEHSSIIYGHDNKIRLHLGVGYFSLLQIQYGFNYKLRIRSDLTLFSEESPAFGYYKNTWGIFRKGVVITPFIDFPLRSNESFTAGIGIGLYF
jgi:hypothetical protein